MQPTDAFAGLQCTACGATHGPDVTNRCPDCGGSLDPTYDYDAVDVSRADLAGDGGEGMAAFAALLPLPAGDLVVAGEGGTPLIDCPGLADDLGVGAVYVKDEGASTTGAFYDRGLALAVAVARQQGATDVALPTMGNDGQAAAAYAARAGLDSHSFAPTRTPFVNKAMINVHGGEMSVVGGRYADAAAEFEETMSEEDWHSVAPFETPYRHEGAKTLAYDVAADLDWSVPDAVVHPTGHGTGLVGLRKGSRELSRLGLVDDEPRLYAAQAEGCAPIARAFDAGAEAPDSVEHPDTIVGPLEIPDPAGGRRALAALSESGGGAAAVDDDAILEAAVTLAETGVTVGASGGAALAATQTLVDDGQLGTDDVVVLVNSNTGNKEADILRSHLMGKGI